MISLIGSHMGFFLTGLSISNIDYSNQGKNAQIIVHNIFNNKSKAHYFKAVDLNLWVMTSLWVEGPFHEGL